ncbi:hypothetical protein V7056_18070 [Bacillus sp. JJ664]
MSGSIGVSYSTSLYEIIGTILAGIILGVILLIYSKKRGVRRTGFLGLGACVLSSFILGLYVQIPVFIIFLFLIKVSSKKQIHT